MQYIALQDFRYAWFFKHQDMPIDDTLLAFVKPIEASHANQLWHQLISNNANHPDLFLKEDWPSKKSSWQETGEWQSLWESDDIELPKLIEEALVWEKNTVVYFCYHADNIIETTWEVFCLHWKNFLFLDNGPILIAKRRKEVVQFHANGVFNVGTRQL